MQCAAGPGGGRRGGERVIKPQQQRRNYQEDIHDVTGLMLAAISLCLKIPPPHPPPLPTTILC